MLDYRIKSRNCAIMHVGTATRDLTQTRCFERVLHFHDTGQEFPSTNVLAWQSDVVETVVGEVPSTVAVSAVTFRVESDEAALGGVGDRLFIAFDPSIKGCTRRNDSTLIRRDGVGDLGRSNLLFGECGLE